VLNALSSQYLVLPDGVAFPGALRLELPAGERHPADAALWYNPHHFPRAWIVHDVEVVEEINARDPDALKRRVEHILFPDQSARDLAHSAVVESDRAIRELTPGGSPAAFGVGEDQESCRVVAHEPQRVVIDATLTRPGLVVLNDLYGPGWHAELDSRDDAPPQAVSIWRTNRMMRGIALRPGRHRITMTYAPSTFRVGAAVSLASWLALLAICGAWCARRKGFWRQP
jgi:hypothetical protein